MRKSMIAVACLLVTGMASAKEAQLVQPASQSILVAAYDSAQPQDATLLQQASAADTWMAAKSSRKGSAAKAAAPEPATRLADPSNRFNMTQNGKKMTADDFDKWMKKNGYRVATGAPAKADDGGTKGAAK
jgi:hypothetical protein